MSCLHCPQVKHETLLSAQCFFFDAVVLQHMHHTERVIADFLAHFLRRIRASTLTTGYFYIVTFVYYNPMIDLGMHKELANEWPKKFILNCSSINTSSLKRCGSIV